MFGIAETHPEGLSAYLVNNLEINHHYTKQDLVTLLHLGGINALRKGVFHRQNSDAILLFICLNKTEYATQYKDNVVGNYLFWEGQERQRIVEKYVSTSTLDVDFFVFIQEYVKQPYLYYGRAIPYMVKPSDTIGIPSKFEFSLYEYKSLFNSSQSPSYFNDPTIPYTIPTIGLSASAPTQGEALVTIRIKQQEYRKNVLQLWNNKCAVSGVDETKWLIASHIRPWRLSDDTQRVDAYNSLLLNPNLDKLFDRGIITFAPKDGRIILPNTNSFGNNLEKMGVTEELRLRTIPGEKTSDYLKYHNNYIFGFNPLENTSNPDFIEELVSKAFG